MLRCRLYVFILMVFTFLHMHIQKMQKLYEVISIHMTKQLDGKLLLNDLKTVSPKFDHILARGRNTLDRVYTNTPSCYKVLPCHHLGQSDHIFLLLLPTYSQVIKRVKPSIPLKCGQIELQQLCRTVNVKQLCHPRESHKS